MQKSIIIVLLVLGILTHAVWFGHPNSAVFDEVHFGKFLSAYFTHEYYFDIHPPLGKLILAGWGWLWGYRPGFGFANIGDVYPDNLYMALRFLPTLAGALLPLVIYGIARQFRLSRPAAVLAGVLVALDNALTVQSRLMLLDPFLLLFGFGALWCYLRWRNGGHTALVSAAGVLGGMAICIKWTGATFLALIVILELARFLDARQWASLPRRALMPIASFVVLPLLIYFSVFAVHFALLTKPGPGDAFMSGTFWSESTIQKTLGLNIEMYRSNQRLTASHPYSSAWFTWPFMQRPIYYWVGDASPAGQARIYLLGNPLVWWLSTVAVFVGLASIVLSGIRKASPVLVIMAGAWLMNLLPFIGVHRVMFLYHYFTALIWAILLLAYAVDQSPQKKKLVLGISVAAVALFVFFAPLTYGLPLSDGAYNARVWFTSWR